MSANVRESLMRRLEMLSEEQALAVLMRLEHEDEIRATPAPAWVIESVKRQLANPGKSYTTEEVRVYLGMEPIPYPRVNRSAPVVEL